MTIGILLWGAFGGLCLVGAPFTLIIHNAVRQEAGWAVALAPPAVLVAVLSLPIFGLAVFAILARGVSLGAATAHAQAVARSAVRAAFRDRRGPHE